jgi:N-acetyl-anhydromuramyl-L-alanine amidase AmpD
MSTVISAHQRSGLWEQIWYSDNGYYDKLDPTVRAKIDALHLDLLDQERSKAIGIPLPAGDTTNIPKAVEPFPISSSLDPLHDPALYSFGEGKLWIPWASEMTSGSRRGTRPKKYPEGAIVHWTAGHRNGLAAGAKFMKSSGMNYFLVTKEGEVGQGDPLDQWGYHAGPSSYAGVSGTVSDELVGFEVQAAGVLRKSGDFFYPWWDEGKNLASNRIPISDVVYSARKANIAPGYYHAFTQEQMQGLRKALCWLHLNKPSVFQIKLILGHDEVSPGRKTDPGAALVDSNGNPITMSQFRDIIADDVRQILANRK